MKVRIKGWKYENIRRMKNVSVDLCQKNGSTYKSSLIMMPNGTGKTTTIALIRGLLSGVAEKWTEKEVRTFSPRKISCGKGKFQLAVSFDDKVYYYILNLDYEKGKAYIQTSRTGETGGLDDGWFTSNNLIGIMDNQEFVKRFVFDGEQAKLTLNVGNAEAERALIYLYQINKIDDMISEIDSLVKIKQESSTGANTSRGIKIAATKMENRKRKWEELERKLNTNRKRYGNISNELKAYQTKYDAIIQEDGRFKERKDSLEQMMLEAQADLWQANSLTMVAVKEPYNIHQEFHIRLRDLVHNMQELKLPKSTAREFFKEIADGSKCICRRCIGPKERKAILENAEKYLGQEELIALNAIKGSLRDYKRTETLNIAISSLQQAYERVQELNLEQRRLESEIAESGNEEVGDVQRQIEELSQEVEKLDYEIKVMEAREDTILTGVDKDSNVYLAEKAYQEAKNVFLELSGTYEFTKKAEKMQKYLQEIKKRALTELKVKVIEKANDKISKIITDDEIVISNIDQHLVLDGRDGASEGQTLATAYAYIGSLFEYSHIDFPFVVDSPAAAMDLNVRREVADVIPELFGQLVVFVTSGEVKGFAESFYKRDNVQYLTLKGEKHTNVECIEGMDFFSTYQSAEEGV